MTRMKRILPAKARIAGTECGKHGMNSHKVVSQRVSLQCLSLVSVASFWWLITSATSMWLICVSIFFLPAFLLL